MTGQRFFIQARLIFHVMDTKAVLNMTTSRYGCPFCRNAHGQHNSWKVVFTGNRNTLPESAVYKVIMNLMENISIKKFL
jgi:hypothetical protein